MQPSPEQIRTQIYVAMTPAEKWTEFCRLRELAWALKKAGLKAQNPDWTDQELEEAVRKIFLYAST